MLAQVLINNQIIVRWLQRPLRFSPCLSAKPCEKAGHGGLNQRSVPSYTQANAMETLREPKEYEKIKKIEDSIAKRLYWK